MTKLTFFSTTTTIYDKYWMILTNAIVFCDIMTWLGKGFGKILTKRSHSNKRSKEIQTIPLISYLFFLTPVFEQCIVHYLIIMMTNFCISYECIYYLIWPKKKWWYDLHVLWLFAWASSQENVIRIKICTCKEASLVEDSKKKVVSRKSCKYNSKWQSDRHFM